MQAPDLKANFENTTKILVFAITSHPVLEYLIEPFAVSKNAKGLFEYDFKKVSNKSHWDYFDNLEEPQLALLELINKYSDESLQKRFKSSGIKSRNFYESLNAEFITEHIRPFIERVMYEAVTLMANHNIPLYFKGDSAERIKETPLALPKELAETCFHFEKLANETHYELQLRFKGKDLVLYNSGAVLISHKPCLLLLGKKLLRFESHWDGQRFKPFMNKEYLVIPASSEKQYYEKFVQKSILHHPFKAKGFEVKLFDEQPVPILRLEQHWQGEIMMGLYFRYGTGSEFHYGDTKPSQVKFIQKWPVFHFEKVIRDFAFEKHIASLLLEYGLKRKDGPYFQVETPVPESIANAPEQQVHACIDWMNLYLEKLVEHNFQLERQIAKKSYYTGTSSLSFEAHDKNDWFDLDAVVQFGKFAIPFTELKNNILEGKREFKLPDGSIALIPTEWMSTYHDLLKFGLKKGNKLEIKKHHFTLLNKLSSQGVKLPVLNSDPEENAYEISPALKAELRTYQSIGYNWMMFLKNNKLGGCLADDMGLGKTLQALALLCRVHLDEEPELADISHNVQEQHQVSEAQLSIFSASSGNGSYVRRGRCSLVVMPLSLIHNWIQEINRFAPQLRVLQHTGTGRATDAAIFSGYDLVLTTYGTVRNDIDLMSRYAFRYVILDESQIIKNASSKIFSAIKKLQCDHRLVLSGTPVENSLTDLWSQFSFINPGMLGSLAFFKDEFVFPIEKKQDEQVAKKLQHLIKPFILRRTKGQVAKELPELTEIIHYCEMTAEQESYYETRKSEIRNAILKEAEERGLDKSRFMVLSGLTKLRLTANHPVIIDQEYAFDSGKYIEIIRNVEKLISENHKVLIFSQFVKHLNLFRNYFQQQGYQYSWLTGSISEKDRKKVIKDFQTREENRLFLISLKAGGVGLNLTGADYVFMLDPWWNPAVEDQAINRAHRIGQHKNVFVYKFITRNTVEEKIVALQQKKTRLAGMFINENNPLKNLSFEELQDLL